MEENKKPRDGNAPVRAESDLKTPEQWAKAAAGRALKPRIRLSYQAPAWRTARHRAAAICHGWDAHKLASAEPFLLNKNNYDDALKAAGSGSIHMDAVSPFNREAAAAELKRLDPETKSEKKKAGS